MEKIIVNLFVPCLGEKFDVYIPVFLTIREVSSLVASMLTEMTNERYVSSGHEILCSVDRNMMLGREYTLKYYDIENGDCLIFF